MLPINNKNNVTTQGFFIIITKKIINNYKRGRVLVEIREVENAEELREVCPFFKDEEELFFTFPFASFPFEYDELSERMKERNHLTVLTENEKIKAFASLYGIKRKESCFVGNVIVAPDARQRGYGKMLLKNIMEKSRKKYKLKEIRIHCNCKNIKGLLFYSGLGFEPCSIFEIESKGVKSAVLELRKVFS